MMRERLRTWWQRATTLPCKACGELVPVTDYREIARTRRKEWWASDAVQLECPNCGDTFWAKK